MPSLRGTPASSPDDTASAKAKLAEAFLQQPEDISKHQTQFWQVYVLVSVEIGGGNLPAKVSIITCRLNRIQPVAPNLSTEPLPRTHHLTATGKGLDGTFSGWKEILALAPAAAPNASSSLQRQPGTVAASTTSAGPGSSSSGAGMVFVRGRGNHMPFRPGGLDDATALASPEVSVETAGQGPDALGDTPNDETGWSKFVPGMKRGLSFSTVLPPTKDDQTDMSADILLREVLGDARLQVKPHRREKSAQNAGVGSHTGGQGGFSSSVGLMPNTSIRYAADSQPYRLD